MQDKKWLVAIVLKDWKPDFGKENQYGPRTLGYIEVSALSEYSARLFGYDSFKESALKDETILSFMEKNYLGFGDIAAAEAVEID